jgi:hypothetical protein
LRGEAISPAFRLAFPIDLGYEPYAPFVRHPDQRISPRFPKVLDLSTQPLPEGTQSPRSLNPPGRNAKHQPQRFIAVPDDNDRQLLRHVPIRLLLLLRGVDTWCDAPGHAGFRSKYGVFFTSLKCRAVWWFLIEWSRSFAVAVTLALTRFGPRCDAGLWAVAFIEGFGHAGFRISKQVWRVVVTLKCRWRYSPQVRQVAD